MDIAGIPQADHVAKWNGSAWSALGANTSGSDGWFPRTAFVYGLTVSGKRVFAGGEWQNANGNPLADRIAEFDGSSWGPVGSDGAGNGPLNGYPDDLAICLAAGLASIGSFEGLKLLVGYRPPARDHAAG